MNKEIYLNFVFVAFIITGSFAAFFLVYYSEDVVVDNSEIVVRIEAEERIPCEKNCDELVKMCTANCDDHMLFNEAIQEGDIDKCAKTKEHEACIESMTYDKAVQSRNLSNCAFDDSSMVENCKITIIRSNALLEDNPQLCESLVDEIQCKDNIYQHRAVRNNNVSMCDFLSPDGIDRCRQAFVPVETVERHPEPVTYEQHCYSECDIKFRGCQLEC